MNVVKQISKVSYDIHTGSEIVCNRMVIEFGTRMVRAGIIPKEGLNKPSIELAPIFYYQGKLTPNTRFQQYLLGHPLSMANEGTWSAVNMVNEGIIQRFDFAAVMVAKILDSLKLTTTSVCEVIVVVPNVTPDGYENNLIKLFDCRVVLQNIQFVRMSVAIARLHGLSNCIVLDCSYSGINIAVVNDYKADPNDVYRTKSGSHYMINNFKKFLIENKSGIWGKCGKIKEDEKIPNMINMGLGNYLKYLSVEGMLENDFYVDKCSYKPSNIEYNVKKQCNRIANEKRWLLPELIFSGPISEDCERLVDIWELLSIARQECSIESPITLCIAGGLTMMKNFTERIIGQIRTEMGAKDVNIEYMTDMSREHVAWLGATTLFKRTTRRTNTIQLVKSRYRKGDAINSVKKLLGK